VRFCAPLTIPEHSEVGSNLRIPSKGLNILKGSGRGDIIITLDITIPKDVR
jgi:DnaJ-class molecular chaperone